MQYNTILYTMNTIYIYIYIYILSIDRGPARRARRSPPRGAAYIIINKNNDDNKCYQY